MKENIPLVAAYGFTDADDHAIPIFTTEVDSYKGKMYKTLEKASLAIKRRKVNDSNIGTDYTGGFEIL